MAQQTDGADVSLRFIQASRRYLTEEYLPKIEHCLSLLTDEEVWWRPNDHSNSIGTLVLHLAGNVRQYIVSGAGGRPDIRRRDEEFAAARGRSPEELADHLRATLDDVAEALNDLDPADLSEIRTVQGREMSVFDAVYHAVEHFSMHTGQIIQTTKQLKDADLAFYTFRDGGVQTRW